MLLVVLITMRELSWHVAGIDLDGRSVLLVRSDSRNLEPYLGKPLDEQLDFLRHRLSGVLQRGCDRLWGRKMKPCEIVFATDGRFPQATSQLLDRVAEHFVQWMTNPRVTFFLGCSEFSANAEIRFEQIAGELGTSHREVLWAGLPAVISAMNEPDRWEFIPNKPTA